MPLVSAWNVRRGTDSSDRNIFWIAQPFQKELRLLLSSSLSIHGTRLSTGPLSVTQFLSSVRNCEIEREVNSVCIPQCVAECCTVYTFLVYNNDGLRYYWN